MDTLLIHSWISASYWAAGIPLETLEKAVENSECFGVFSEDGAQVGFARAITDYTTFAYLADVFISENHRGKGLSKMLMQYVFSSPKLQGLRRSMLATRDAHKLYSQFGFTALNDPNIFMEKWNPDAYKNA